MKNRKFTLIEILGVIVIIGVLAAIAIGTAGYVLKRGEVTETETGLKVVEGALEKYKAKFGSYPVSANGNYFCFPTVTSTTIGTDDSIWSCFDGVTFSSNGSAVTAIKGLNIKNDGTNIYILDSWDNNIIYLVPGVFNKSKYDLGSAGPDGKLGSDGSAISTFSRTSTGNFGKGDDIVNFKRDE